MKMFRTSSTSNIRDLLQLSNCRNCVKLQAVKFLHKHSAVVNVLYETFAQVALHQLSLTQFALD